MSQSITAGDGQFPKIPRLFGSSSSTLVQNYQEGKGSKSERIRGLVRLLIDDLECASRPGDNINEEVLSVLRTYLEILNVLDKERAGAKQDGIHSRDDRVQVAKKQVAATQKRRREDEEEPAKQPIDLELIPFGRRRESIKLPDDLRVTRELQDNYGRDPAYAKTMLLRDRSRPEFPSTLWENVLANSFINFDHIFTNLSFPVGRVREVVRSRDWVFIWDKYEKAVLFAFPHRELELQKYKSHIQGLFLAMPETPKNVIHYDQRVRARVADSNSLRLCDLSEFNSDYLWFIGREVTMSYK